MFGSISQYKGLQGDYESGENNKIKADTLKEQTLAFVVSESKEVTDGCFRDKHKSQVDNMTFIQKDMHEMDANNMDMLDAENIPQNMIDQVKNDKDYEKIQSDIKTQKDEGHKPMNELNDDSEFD